MDKKSSKDDLIIVKGARTHNLKNITVEMPRNKMIVFTGLSGSGKSSLAFDTIFAEGQRRYVESLSSYARQFLRQMQKPDVDEIVGLSPAISIDQKSRSNNPRSTVATITEIYDYLRILYARIGRPHCLVCGNEIKKLSNEEIKNFVLEKVSKTDSDIEIWSPIVRGRKGEYYQLLYDLLGKGYTTVLVDGKKHSLRERINLTKTKKHEISVLVDFINPKEFSATRIGGSASGGKLNKNANERLSEAIEKAIQESDGLVVLKLGEEEHLLSAKWACPKDGFSFPEIEPRLFSFNSPYGACPDCNGLGTKYFFGTEACESCQGKRLRQEALSVLVGGKNIVELTALSIKDSDEFFKKLKLTIREKNISKVVTKEIEARLSFMLDVGIGYLSLDRRAHTLSGGEAQRIRLASQLGSGLVGALYVLDEPTIGLHARDNARLIKTLLNLRDLGNTIIVVEHDEETIYSSDYLVDIGPGAGIHGGRIVAAGYLDDLLFGEPARRARQAGKNDSKSLTLAYLRGEKSIELPEKRRSAEKGKISIRGGSIFNIKHINADIPLGRLVAVTGVSGSGKSSFVYEVLHKNLQARLDRRYRNANTYNCQTFTGSEYLGRSILIDQSPIGRTPRSNPATYTGAFTFIRELFAETAEARARGWRANRFSFNVKGGRCETCQGNGMIEVEMHFLPTVYVPCDVCLGKRFMKET
ncbi:MAG: ABC-ATPase UvrA, partial [Parcubacteria group bacterium]